ncbi:MAG: hypothetical protein H7Y06_10375 [Opitutaceae bacterium]|nr:hypothetical protein [Opitutaceae bacterium]
MAATSAMQAETTPPALVVNLADQPLAEKPSGRLTLSKVKKDRYMLYITAGADDLVSFTVQCPRSGVYRASTRLFNQQDQGMARLIVNDFTDGPSLPLTGTLQHGNVELAAGANTVTYQLSGTAPKTKVRLWELTFTPVVVEKSAAPTARPPDTPGGGASPSP